MNKSQHGIFGYSDTDDTYFHTLQSWFSRRFGWKIEPDWLVKTPGVVTAIHIAVRALTNPGEAGLDTGARGKAGSKGQNPDGHRTRRHDGDFL